MVSGYDRASQWRLLFRARQATLVRVLICLIALSPVLAHAAPPPQLLGKSVIVSGSERRTFRWAGGGDVQTANQTMTWTVYISTAGRVFVRNNLQSSLAGNASGGGGASKAIDTAPTGGSRDVVQFSGNTMTITAQFQSGASRITATFDGGFSSCSAGGFLGREGGKSVMLRDRYSGQMIEVLSSQRNVSGCSVQAGNALGGQ